LNLANFDPVSFREAAGGPLGTIRSDSFEMSLCRLTQRYAEGSAYRIDRWAWSGSQQRATAILFDLNLAEVIEIIDDVLSFQTLATARPETVKQLFAQNQSEEIVFLASVATARM
jgi:hypothetical protein